MNRFARHFWLLAALASAVCGSALAQTRPMATPGAPVPLAPAPSAPPGPPAMPDAVRGQPITIDAGTGLLLPLPRPAATIMSAEPAIARVQPASPTSLFLMGVAAGRTTVVATSDSGAPIVQYDVTVVGNNPAHPGALPAPVLAPTTPTIGPSEEGGIISPQTAATIERTIHQTVPGGTALHARADGTRLVMTGTVATPVIGQQAEAIARGYVGDRAVIVGDFAVLSSIQVNVRVRIAEIDRTITRQLGFNWQALGNNGFRFGLLTNAAAATTPTLLSVPTVGFPASTFNPLQALGLTSAPSQIGAGFTSGNWDVNAIIDALATDQLVTILAEPNLTAQSGEPASFLAGGEFPIPVAGNTSNGTTTITVEFKQYGVSLEVVPTVLSPGRLNLRVRPEVSQLSTTGAVSVPIAGGTLTIPALTVRRAETTVELGSGQSFAIAGLLQKNTMDTTNTVPGIGELPVLGALFKSTNFQRGESELVIIVTPYLVKPVANPESFQLPTDGYRPATDLDHILLGRQIARPSGAPLDAGFILK